MNALDADRLETLMKSLQSAVEPTDSGPEDPLEQLIYSFLLWEAPGSKAGPALRRLLGAFTDVNELRVALPDEIMAALGDRYPRLDERVLRLGSALNQIYLREHAVTLAPITEGPKREARKYLDSLEHVPGFVSARVALLSLGVHAAPVDEQMLVLLQQEQVVPEDAEPERVASAIERAVRAADMRDVYLRLEAWSDTTSKGKRPKGRKSTPAAS